MKAKTLFGAESGIIALDIVSVALKAYCSGSAPLVKLGEPVPLGQTVLHTGYLHWISDCPASIHEGESPSAL
jgi:hypothetical protein